MKKIISEDAKSPEKNRRLEGLLPSKDIFDSPCKRQKPQISSIPGISPKNPRRYQVMLGDEVVATGLSSDEALELAKWPKQDLSKIINLES